MRHLIYLGSFFLFLLTFNLVNSQNIFDSTTANYFTEGLESTIYKPTKFEQYIKLESKKSLDSSNKIILLTLKGRLIPFYFDSVLNTVVYNKYILLSYKGEDCWVATAYLEVPRDNKIDETIIMKSSQIKLSENSQLFQLRTKWDSLKKDWYLPFVSKIQLNGITGYFQNQADDCQDICFYSIDKTNAVFKSLYRCDSDKEWKFQDDVIKNVNYDYNYSQPTFATIIYLLPLYDSVNLFSNFKAQ